MLLFADFETFYSSEYTLKKMTPAEYILSPLFQCHGMAFRIGEHGTTKWVDGPDLPSFFRALRATGKPVTMVTYNALFDMCIAAWKYGFFPALMIDVLGMVRANFGPAMNRHSLAFAAEYLQVPQGSKGDTIVKVMGMRTDDIIRAGLWPEFVGYGKQDVDLMIGIYRHIMPQFPLRELAVMDLVLRCAVQPQLVFDKALLEQHLIDTKARKADLIAQCGLQYDENGKCPELMSTAKFATLLEAQGIPVEMKTTLTGRQAPALAKTDAFMSSLLEHENETVAALAAARLGHKSTLEETRCQRFINIASLPSAPGYIAGAAPMPLRYGAAHTHRLGGDWSLNVQNLPRKSNLRRSIKAPKGSRIVTADEAQIEARISAWIAKETTLLREFTDNLDPYGQLGATIFSLPAPVKGDKDWRKIHHPVEGFIGKTGILGLGFGAGADKFHTMVNAMARTGLSAENLAKFSFDEALAQKSVSTYRNRYHRMPACWRLLQNEGMAALTGESVSCVIHPVVIKRGMIWGPNGQRLLYPDLKHDANTGDWTYKSGRYRAKIYGAKLLENITQWLARIIVMEAGVRLNAYGLRFALQAHDELVFVVPEAEVVSAKALIKREMERRPTWGQDIPLEAETGEGDNYGAAK